MSYNNSFFPAFQFLAEPYVVFAHQPMNLPYPKGRLPQKFHWNNFRGGYGHPYYSMIGHDYLIGPTAGQHDLPTLPSMTIWPFTLHLYGGSFITQLDQQLQCPWMSIQDPSYPLWRGPLFAVTQPVSDWDSLPDISQWLCRLCSYAMDLWMPPLRPGWAPIPQLLRC